MPLVTRRIDTSYAYVDSEKYAKLARFHVLQGTNTASLVGALEQIGLLADYATEIFNDIYKFSSRLNDRISDATTRTSSLLAQLPDEQAQFTSKDLNIYASPALFKQGEQFPETAMLLPSSKPRSLQQYYDSPAMGRIPAVADMDALLPPEDLATRGPCANSYSYPGFFMDEWKKAEAERRKVLEAERQRRRKERAERKQKLKQLKEREAQAVKGKEKKNRLDWRERLSAGPRPSDVPSAAASISEPPKPELLFKRVFEDVDDEEDVDTSQPSAAPKPAVPPPISAAPLASPPVPPSAPPPISIASSAPPSSAAPPSMPPPPPGKTPPPGAPPPLPSTAPPPPIPLMAPPPMPNSAPPPLPVGAPPSIPLGPPSIPSGPPPIPSGPPPIPSGPPPIAPTPLSAPPRMPAPPPPTSPPISPPVSPTAPPSAPPPPAPLQPPRPAIPPPPLSDEPPIARPPNPFGSGDDARNNLLTSITQGKKLRAAKDEPAPVKQLPGAPPKLDMLTAIRRGSVLRKVETNAPKPPQRKESLGAFSGDAVASILARRKHLQADDTESDEDDDNEW